MSKLKLGPIADEKPVKITAELPAATYRDLVAYADAFGRDTGQAVEPAQLVAPMIARFMSSDRGFVKAHRRRSPETAVSQANLSPVRAQGSEIA